MNLAISAFDEAEDEKWDLWEKERKDRKKKEKKKQEDKSDVSWVWTVDTNISNLPLYFVSFESVCLLSSLQKFSSSFPRYCSLISITTAVISLEFWYVLCNIYH